MKLVVQIALGILLAALIALIAQRAYIRYQIHQYAKSAEQTRNDRAEAEKMKRMEELARRRDENLEKARKREESSKRSAAWQKFYQKPVECGDRMTSANLVECANHEIRARSEFDKLYSANKL